MRALTHLSVLTLVQPVVVLLTKGGGIFPTILRFWVVRKATSAVVAAMFVVARAVGAMVVAVGAAAAVGRVDPPRVSRGSTLRLSLTVVMAAARE